MSKKVKVKLFRKAPSWDSIDDFIASGAFEVKEIEVRKTVEFTPARFGDFCERFLQELDCTAGLDYLRNIEAPAAVEITCKDKRTIYVVPEAYGYPRYIGIDDCNDEWTPVYRMKLESRLEFIANVLQHINHIVIDLDDYDFNSENVISAIIVGEKLQQIYDVLIKAKQSKDANKKKSLQTKESDND